MLVYNQEDLRRANWLGLKPLLFGALSVGWVRSLAYATGRKVLPDGMLHRLPVFEKEVEFRLRSGAVVRLTNPQVDYVAKDIFWGNGRLVAPAEDLILDMVEFLAKDATMFLDIGSYSGLFAMIAARANPDLTAVTFEIVPENHRLIEQNLRANELDDRIEARHLGLAASAGTLVLPEHTGSVSHPASLSLGSKFESGIKVPLSTLDAGNYTGRLLMKIDVEGFEWDVFQGGKRTFTQLKPDIICEFLPEAPECAEVEAFLKPLGYRFFIGLSDGFAERSSIAPVDGARDWLLTTRPAPFPVGADTRPRAKTSGVSNAQIAFDKRCAHAHPKRPDRAL